MTTSERSGTRRIRIHYGVRVEEVVVTPVDPDDASNELFRVDGASVSVDYVSRGDIVRLSPLPIGEYSFEKVVEQSDWETMRLPLPEDARDRPALIAFRQTMISRGAIWEGEWHKHPYLWIVISLPRPADPTLWQDAYATLIEAAAGIDAGEFLIEVAANQKRSDPSPPSIVQRVRPWLATFGAIALLALGFRALQSGSSHDLPRLFAMAMLGCLLLALLTPGGWRQYVVWVPGLITSLASVELLTRSSPPYVGVSVAGFLHAIWVGAAGLMIGVASAFRSGSESRPRLLTGVELPYLLSAIAGVALAVTALVAAARP